MPTSAPMSSSSSSSSPSPSVPLDINGDPNEILGFLLQAIAQQSRTNSPLDSASPSPPDLPRPSSWSHQTDAELYADLDFNFPLSTDPDPPMAADTSPLQFCTVFDQSSLMLDASDTASLQVNGMVHNQPLYQEPVWPSHVQPVTGTSSSSTSSTSLSSMVEPASAASGSPSMDILLNDPVLALAQRARQVAGVTLAVPVSAHTQQLAAAGGQPKLPIPRISLGQTRTPWLDDYHASATSVIGRPKTSHTITEQRYRKNLSDRLNALKQSIPALRVLELEAGASSPYGDVVDARGFVDGVKVAKNVRKPTIYCKATEYIRVLKKREARMRREQEGLKSVVNGLLGGPALLEEWERGWRECFGGAEKDEIEGEDGAAGSENEEGDGEEGYEEELRPRKKAKAVAEKEMPRKPPAPPAVPLHGQVPEKRKRGRPRKVPLPVTLTASPLTEVAPPAASSASNVVSIHPTDQSTRDGFVQTKPENATARQQPAQQYLLAVFAFLSVFNRPFTSSQHMSPSSHHQTRHGTVLTPHTPTETQVPTYGSTGDGLHDILQTAHLLVSTLVFFCVLLPWLSGMFQSATLSACTASVFSRLSTTFANAAQITNGETITAAELRQALSSAAMGCGDGEQQLREALGVSTGLAGLLRFLFRTSMVDRGTEQLRQRAWIRLGELVALDGSADTITRLQTSWCILWHIPTPLDLPTLALIVRPVSPATAAILWERARKREALPAHERIVLDSMTVEGAADRLAKWRKRHETERKDQCTTCEQRTPFGILAALIVRERLRKHAAMLFVRTVEDASRDAGDKDRQARKETIAAGKALGGRTATLAALLERAAGADCGENEDDDDDEDAGQDAAEIRSLLAAMRLYQRVFPCVAPGTSHMPSPSAEDARMHAALRTELGSGAFADDANGRLGDEGVGEALEDARDRVVDMLVDFDRRRRSGA